MWDTPGSEKFRNDTLKQVKDAKAVIVVFDVTIKESLIMAGQWIEDLRDKAPTDCIIVMAGNKIDLDDDKEVSTEQLISFAQK